MKDRIQKFLTVENISPSKFADEIGIQRSSISHILSGRNNPSLDVIQKILLRFPYLNAEWLITGKGEMFKPERHPSLFDNPITEIEEKKDKISQQDEQKNDININVTTHLLGDVKEQNNATKTIEKIIILYSDGTAEVFNVK